MSLEFVCLAAGRGTRMGRLGAYLQKCMYPVGLRPFLELTMTQAASAGGARVHVVVGHHAEQVGAYFGSEYGGMRVEYVRQDEPLGTGHALGLLAERLAGATRVLVWQGDVYVPCAVFAALEAHGSPNAVTLVSEPEAGPELLATVEGDRVRRVWGGAGPWSDGGVWKLETRLLAALGGVGAPSGPFTDAGASIATGAPDGAGAQARPANAEVRALPNLQRLIDAGEAEVGAVVVGTRLHLGGTHPTPEANVAGVVRRLLEEGRGR